MLKRRVANLSRLAVQGLVIAVGVALVLVAAPSASAASWDRSFDPAALGSLVIPGRTRVTLVAAGEPSSALDDARLALGAALKASGKWTLVDADLVRDMDPGLEDTEVVALERDARDVEAIWIVRLLPGRSGAPATAIVTLYAPLGPLLRAFEVTEGEPMRVVTSEPDHQAEYLRQRISPVRDGRIDTSASREVFNSDGGFAKDGVRLLEPRELYIALGRYDLLRDYDSVAEDRSMATIISGSVIFVGVVLFMQDVFDNGGLPSLQLGALGISGIVAGGLGAVGVVVARTIDPDPLDWAGKVEAATTYNGSLKKRLALPTDARHESRTRGARVTSVGMSPLSDGLGLTVGGTF